VKFLIVLPKAAFDILA